MNEGTKQYHRFSNGLRGKLHKQGVVFKNWRPHYFILEKKKFRYFSDETSSKVVGEFNIDSSTQVYDVSGESEGRKFLFYVKGRNDEGVEEVIYMSAASDAEKADWIEALYDSVHDGLKLVYQPELWDQPFFPGTELIVSYTDSADTKIENGNIIRPACTESPPRITFRSSNSDKHSLLLIDFDSIVVKQISEDKIKLLWGIVNFSGSDLSTGDEVAPYQAPAPPYNSGLHRYFFILYRHKTAFTSHQLNETVEAFLNREEFPYFQWTESMEFGSPCAINGFYAGWEEYCDVLHTKSGYQPPELYRSPKQEIEAAAAAELEYQKKIEETKMKLAEDMLLGDVFRHGVDFSVPSMYNSISLCITFSGRQVESGEPVPPAVAAHPPVISYKCPNSAFSAAVAAEEKKKRVPNIFSLIVTDPDAPSRHHPSMREFVHWVVVNIPGDNVGSGGIEILPYAGPAPPHNSGRHRYTYCLYRQNRSFEADEMDAARSYFAARSPLRSHEWVVNVASDILVSNPVGLEVVTSEWDDSVDAVHAKMGWLPPAQYRSPKQQAEEAERERVIFEAAAGQLWDKVFPLTIHSICESITGDLVSVAAQEEAAREADVKAIEKAMAARATDKATAAAAVVAAQSAAAAAVAAGKSAASVNQAVTDKAMTERMAADKARAEAALRAAEMAVANSKDAPAPSVTPGKIDDDDNNDNDDAQAAKLRAVEEYFKTLLDPSTLAAWRARSPDDDEKTPPFGLSEYASGNNSFYKNTSNLNENEMSFYSKVASQMSLKEGMVDTTPIQQSGMSRLNSVSPFQMLLGADGKPTPDGSFDLQRTLSDTGNQFLAEQQQQLARQRSQQQQQEQRQAAVSALDTDNDSTKGGPFVKIPPTGDNLSVGGGSVNGGGSVGGTSVKKKSIQRSASKARMVATDRDMSSGMSVGSARGVRSTIASSSRPGNASDPPPPAYSASPSQKEEFARKSSKSSMVRKASMERRNGPTILASGNDALDDLLGIPTSYRHTEASYDSDDDTSVVSRPPVKERAPSPTRGVAAPGGGGSRSGSPPRTNMNMGSTHSSPRLGTPRSDKLGSPRSEYRSGSPGREKPPVNMSVPVQRAGSVYVADHAYSSNSSQMQKKKSILNMFSASSDKQVETQAQRQSLDHKSFEPATTKDEMFERVAQATTISQLCNIFDVNTPSIFEGETMSKKFSKDFRFKDSFIWIDPQTKSIHWAKNAAEKASSSKHKFFCLDKTNSFQSVRASVMEQRTLASSSSRSPSHKAERSASLVSGSESYDGSDAGTEIDAGPQGDMKGIVKLVENTGSTIMVTVESGEFMELKLSPDGIPPAAQRAVDWVRVIRAFNDVW